MTITHRSLRTETMFWPISRTLAAAFLFGFCGMAAHAARYLEPHSASAADYYWIKAQLVGSFARTYQGLEMRKDETFNLDEFIFDWRTSEDWLWNAAQGVRRDDLLAELAIRVIVWKKTLPLLGYPSSVWKTDLLNYETVGLKAILARPRTEQVIWRCFAKRFPQSRHWFNRLPTVDEEPSLPTSREEARYAVLHDCEDSDPTRVLITESLMGPLVASLGKYHSRTKKLVAPISVESPAMGGATPQIREIVWQPVGGSLRIIPLFYYELCAWRKINPDDPSKCANWKEVLEPTFEGLGKYRFFAKWPDGKTRRGQVEINEGNAGKKTWVLKP